MSNEDAINPKHYRGLVIDGHEIQCIDVIEVLDLGFHLGNALKYAWRFGRKPTTALTSTEKNFERHDQLLEEAGKCEWYLDRWRAQGYEQRAMRELVQCNVRLELSGHLRQLISFARVHVQRSRDLHAAAQAAKAIVSTEQSFDPIPYMHELIDLLDINEELIKHVSR